MPDNPVQTQPVQGPSGSTPAAPAAVASPAPAQPQSQGRPWDNDLSFIPDAQVRSQVSEYLAQTWQPRMTQLEQQNAAATSLYEDFRSNPRDTLREVAAELIEAELVKPEDLKDVLPVGEPQAQPEPQTPEPSPADPQHQRDPEVQALLDRERERAEKEAFDAEYERVKQAHPDLALDYDLYLQSVAETGDFDQAVERYQDKFGDFDRYLREQATAEPQTDPTAPPVADPAAGTGEVATEPKYETLDEAIDDYFAEQSATGEQPTAAVPSAPAPPVATG